MFIAALFIIARTWKQPRCPSADKWIGKLWYIYTMEYYSAIKKNTFESVLMRWMKLEPIIQSEVSQKGKHQYSMLLLLLSRFSRVRLCATPQTAAHQAPPSLGFSRQEHWSGLPFPFPMHESEKWTWSWSVVSDFQQPHGLQPTRLLHPWGFPGKSIGVGCHCLLNKEDQIRMHGIRNVGERLAFPCFFSSETPLFSACTRTGLALETTLRNRTVCSYREWNL